MGVARRRDQPPAVTAASAWTRQAEAATATLERISKLSAIHGSSWQAGMLRYYARQLGQLLAQAPPGTQRQVRAFRKRVKQL